MLVAEGAESPLAEGSPYHDRLSTILEEPIETTEYSLRSLSVHGLGQESVSLNSKTLQLLVANCGTIQELYLVGLNIDTDLERLHVILERLTELLGFSNVVSKC